MTLTYAVTALFVLAAVVSAAVIWRDIRRAAARTRRMLDELARDERQP